MREHNNKPSILVIERDNKFFNALCPALSNYMVTRIQDSGTAKLWLDKVLPDMLLLDLKLRKLTGLELLKWIRKKYERLPILVVTPYAECRIIALEMGADDSINQPVSVAEVVIRLQMLQRHMGRSHTRSYGDLKLEWFSRRAFKSDKEINLTKLEFLILDRLMQQDGGLVSLLKLQAHLFGDNQQDYRTQAAISRHIGSLRKKLGEKDTIETINDQGYRLKALIAIEEN